MFRGFQLSVKQGVFYCGALPQADFFLNYFLSNFLKFILKLWAVLGSGGLYWTVLGFTGLYFVVFGYTWLY